MYWEYSESVSREKWLGNAGTVQQDLRTSVYNGWLSTATQAGFTEVSHNDGVLSPQWVDGSGNLTGVSQGGSPDAYKLTITGEVS